VSTNNDGDPTEPPADTTAGYTVNAANAGSLFWRVTYSGNNTSIAGSSSACIEDSTVTIDNTTAPPTP
jgi:hypothetical protein